MTSHLAVRHRSIMMIVMMVEDRPASSLPRVPGRLPLIGHLPRLHFGALDVVRRAQLSLGPLFWVDYGFGLEYLYVTGPEAFALLKNDRVDSYAAFLAAETVVEDTLSYMDGASHRRQRMSMSGPFTNDGLARARIGALIDEIVSERIASWGRNGTVRVSAEMREMALDIIFRIIGVESSELPQWRTKYHDFLLGIINLPSELPGTPRWRSRRARKWLDERCRVLIDRCRREGDRSSLLGAMVHGHDEDGRGLTDAELVGNLRLLGLAGHETTASVMAWMLLFVAHQPELWDRLCEEALAHDGPPCTPAELARFPFAEALFRETLRIYPPIWFVYRRATTDLVIEGVRIDEGTILVIPLITFSRDPERYPVPDRLDPDRWLELGRSPRSVELCQFGGGPHFCLGYRLALLEGIQLIVSAAQQLSRRGLRPAPAGAMPRPRYMPVVRPPGRSRIVLVSR